jgi:hypothetical protein
MRDAKRPSRVQRAVEHVRCASRARWPGVGLPGARGGRAIARAMIAALLLACSRADSQHVAGSARAAAVVRPLDTPTFAGVTGYRVALPAVTGRITGSVSFDGPAPVDSIVHLTVDADVCGQTLVDISVDHRGPRLANVVVWLDGVVAGKSLPLIRRYDITTEGCRLIPRVQTAVVGGTLNVRNADQTTHRTSFIQSTTNVVLATILETEAGAVVPSRAILTAPGLIMVRCAEHPWSQAWLAVFDQPYFTTTDINGSFTIDSIPPGRYRITAWHERFGTQADSVTVVAGGSAVVGMKYEKKMN